MAELSPQTDGCRIVVLSGPSGSGKSTIVNRLIEESPVRLMKAISATTRPKRAGEIDGDDYYFLSSEEFDAKRQAGEFLEYEEVHSSGYWYGTLQSELKRIGNLNAWSFLEIDVNGALRIKKLYPDALTIFLKASSEDVYEQRLRGRGTESEEVIQRRLNTVRNELKLASSYDYQVVNDHLDRAVAEIIDIISSREAQLHA